jgi:hypothetical protein
MLESLILSWKLRKLERAKRLTLANYKKRIRQARKVKNEDEIESLQFDEQLDIEEIDDEAHQLQNDRIIQLANRYLIPVPEFQEEGGAWEECERTGEWRLRVGPLAELRAAVRKERRDLLQGKILWASGLTGVIGTLTGLVSALHAWMSASK